VTTQVDELIEPQEEGLSRRGSKVGIDMKLPVHETQSEEVVFADPKRFPEHYHV
jgi:hypothetical protein